MHKPSLWGYLEALETKLAEVPVWISGVHRTPGGLSSRHHFQHKAKTICIYKHLVMKIYVSRFHSFPPLLGLSTKRKGPQNLRLKWIPNSPPRSEDNPAARQRLILTASHPVYGALTLPSPSRATLRRCSFILFIPFRTCLYIPLHCSISEGLNDS